MFQLLIEHCNKEEAQTISDALEETEALSITLADQFDDPILEPAPGEFPLWLHVMITVLFEHQNEAECALKSLKVHYSHLSFSLSFLPPQDWERTCVIDFKPQQFGQRLWVCPSWMPPPEVNAVNLILDPGLAFGTGTHQTTSLCLTWLEQADLNYKKVIDYGCGSGILGLSALKLGAAHVSAVDIDDQALLATRNNASNNQITDTQLSVGKPETLKEPVDLIIANILLSPLIDLVWRFHELLLDTGYLVVSGVLAHQIPLLTEAYLNQFNQVAVFQQDEWALIVFSPKMNATIH
jgi:ribosomal protein L11 methyltransferase